MAGYRTWSDDDDLTAADVNGYLVGQVVCRFDSEAERDAQMGGAVEGQICWVSGVGHLKHNGTDWESFATAGSLGETGPDGLPGPAGPDGPQGPPGPPGSATSFVHTQTVPGSVWTIPHNLGFDPAGQLVIIDGFAADEFGVQILTPGVSMRLSFENPVAGTAHLS